MIQTIWLISAILLTSYSCDDFVTVPAPETQLFQSVVFEDDDTGISALAGVYFELAGNFSFSDGYINSVTLTEGLYSDELISYSTTPSPRTDFYFNTITPQNATLSSNWNSCYKIIYECNRIVEGASASAGLTLETKSQLIGEATFIRAFCHFYLVNLFGDVPLITTSDYRTNAKVSRTPASEVYEQIVIDLLSSKDLLPDAYPSESRVRVNKGAAIAMLSRAYLYNEDFVNAEFWATELINKTSQYVLENLNSVFLKNSQEAIWQLVPGGGSQNYTNEGFLFILRSPPTGTALRKELYDQLDANDLRKIHWIDSVTSSSGLTKFYFAHKYKENPANATNAEYSMVLRLAEQFLIRAEARARQEKIAESQADINTIRNRAGLENTAASTKEELLMAIEHERRAELFTEWGHRFFDLKRTGRLDAVMGSVKSNWRSHHAFLPLPQPELLSNPNLNPQNPGY